jgi:two-component system LytT family response regulator
MPQYSAALTSDERVISASESTAVHAVAGHSHERVREPLTIAFRQAATIPAANANEVLPHVEGSAAWKSGRIAIKANGRIILIDPTEILVAEAQGNYVLLQQSKGSVLLRGQISALAEKLQPYGLIRIHRSFLVNAAHVEGMEALVTGEYLLRMRGGKEYNVTRTYKKNLQQLAATWIGTSGFVAEQS